jgi:hypothetical protein
MLTQSLVVAGAALYGVLGTLHLVYTLFTDKFAPLDAATQTAMQATSPQLTRRTSVWDAWIGFNASHSLGALLFSAVYLALALGHMPTLRDAPVLLWLAVLTSFAYLAIAVRYWFRTPLIGIALATACFLGAALSAAR